VSQKRAEPDGEPFSSPVLRSKIRWLGFALFIFILFSGNGGVVFKPVAPPGNGNGLGVVQETIQKSHRRWAKSPKSLPHSSSGRLLVMMVDRFSYLP